MERLKTLLGQLLLLTAVIGVVDVHGTESLQSYNIDDAGISVSGISSGGHMAHQFHVAYSAVVRGAGIIAGGPYHCAGNRYPFNLWKAMNKCMDAEDWLPFLGPPHVDASIAEARHAFRRGTIDDPANLAESRVYLFSGTRDRVVPRAVMDVVRGFYDHFDSTITYVNDMPAGHAMVTDDDGANACGVSQAPFINDCDYDSAGELLEHLYGRLNEAVPWKRSSLLSFDQSEFVDDPEAYGMQSVGRVYVPDACNRLSCRLHIALHGCGQSEAAIGDAFYTRAGYNGWAEANNIIVLYPQAAAKTYLLLPWPNPNGCWDWWGYTGSHYHTQRGAQMGAIKAMLDRLRGLQAKS